MIPYGRQQIDDDDIAAVVDVLKSDWLTTGPKVSEFERAVAEFVGAEHAVAVNSGTAALHAMMAALNIGRDDEVIVPTLTFAATANSVVYQGGTPVFADVDPETLLICPDSVERLITSRTRAIVAVDYAGQPCDYTRLKQIADRHQLTLLSDGCHALGASWHDCRVGSIARMTSFSFHPVKPVTTGEGGMVTTNDAELATRMRVFRNHGIVTDARQREEQGTWFYQMQSLGFNYRISDVQCALGIRQMQKLPGWIDRRNQIADRYDRYLGAVADLTLLKRNCGHRHGFHLYVVRVAGGRRNQVFQTLRENGVGVNVHYVPVHLHPFYQERFGTRAGICPEAEAAFDEILSLPVHPGLTTEQQDTVIQQLTQALAGRHSRAA
jgi:perosamine synthetase